MSKRRRRFTPEFKAQAVELAQAGRPVSELAADLEVGSDLLYRWIRESGNRTGAIAEGAQLGGEPDRAAGEEGAAAEQRSLRAQVARLSRENDILKKAAVILGTDPQPKSAK